MHRPNRISSLDRWYESGVRRVARYTSRRSVLQRLGLWLLGPAVIPLLPVARAGQGDAPPPDDPGDPRRCEYWRYCGFDSFLCACCGGSHTGCPPGTVPAAITWVGTCRNPADGKDYVISYNDCCGQSSCGRCPCSRHEGATPVYTVGRSNDVDWCTGTPYSFVPSCSTALVIGVAPNPS